MPIQQMDHVGVVVRDLAAAIRFFVALGLEQEGEVATVEGRWVDRIVGLDGVRSEIVMVRTPDGNSRLELTRFHTPPGPAPEPDLPSNTPGIRHLTFRVDEIDDALARVQPLGGELIGEVVQYENLFRLCYLRGPEGIIVELTQQIG